MHMKIHINQEKHENNQVYCDYCQNTFSNKHGFAIHIAKMHEDLKCDICGFTSKSNNAFDLHKEIGHVRNQKPSTNLKRTHSLSKIDIPENLPKCTQCEINFNTRHSLNKHMRSHKSPSMSSPPTKKPKENDNKDLDITESSNLPTDLTASQRLLLPDIDFLDDLNQDTEVDIDTDAEEMDEDNDLINSNESVALIIQNTNSSNDDIITKVDKAIIEREI